jgi:hypothetical protein
MCLSYCHPYSISKALTQRASCTLDPGGNSIFGMPGCTAAPLTELLKVVYVKIIPGKKKQAVKKHGPMAG